MREPNFSFSTSLIKMRMPTTTGRTWESFKTCAATRPESTLCWPTRISSRSAYSYYPHTHHQHHHHQHHYHQPVYPAGVHTLLKLYTLTILILTNNISKNKSWFHGFLTTNIPITTHSAQKYLQTSIFISTSSPSSEEDERAEENSQERTSYRWLVSVFCIPYSVLRIMYYVFCIICILCTWELWGENLPQVIFSPHSFCIVTISALFCYMHFVLHYETYLQCIESH